MSTTGRLIVVVGSRGGAGASCLAAAIAKAVQGQTERSVLVDLCDGGAGLEVLLGIESEPGARWSEIAAARGEIDGSELVSALPQWQGLPVLSISRHHSERLPDEVVLDVCAGLLRNGYVVVLDLPGPGAWTLAIRALVTDADQVLIATPDSTVGIAGAVATALAIDQINAAGSPNPASDATERSFTSPMRRRRLPQNDRAVALRTRRGSRIAEDDVAQLVGLPVLVRFRDDRNLATAIELGAGPVSKAAKNLTRAGQEIASQVVK